MILASAHRTKPVAWARAANTVTDAGNDNLEGWPDWSALRHFYTSKGDRHEAQTNLLHISSRPSPVCSMLQTRSCRQQQ